MPDRDVEQLFPSASYQATKQPPNAVVVRLEALVASIFDVEATGGKRVDLPKE